LITKDITRAAIDAEDEDSADEIMTDADLNGEIGRNEEE
jgi:hypothetical protein